MTDNLSSVETSVSRAFFKDKLHYDLTAVEKRSNK